MSETQVTINEGVKPELGILGKLGGRKFLMAILGVAAVSLHKYFAWIDPNDVLAIGAIVVSYIFGQSISDGMTGGATSTTTPVVDPAEISKSIAVAEVAKMGTAMVDNGATPKEVGVAIDKLSTEKSDK